MTELCNGTLHDLVVKKSFPFAVADYKNKTILRQIAVGLRYLHANGVIHRDLKPGNILFTTKGSRNLPVMKLADFGMSRILKEDQSHLTRTQLMDGYSPVLIPFGTDGWIAPEILKGERKYKESVDIFPLGLIFAFTLSGGRHPFDVDPPNDKETNEEKIQRTMKRNERIQNEVSTFRIFSQMTLTVDQLKEDDRLAFDLIQSMLSPNPSDRPSTEILLQHEYFRIRRDPQVGKKENSVNYFQFKLNDN